MSIRLILCFCFLVLFIVPLVFADMFMWKDKAGKVHITQSPPPSGATIVKVIRQPTPTATPKDQVEEGREGEMTPTPDTGSGQAVNKDTPSAQKTAEPTPTPETDKNGHDAGWWKSRKSKLEGKLEERKQKMADLKKELRILSQGHRRPDEEDAKRNQLAGVEEDIEQLERELDGLEDELKRAGGYPGWIR